MPEMKVHSSGGLVFVPTKEEKEVRTLKQTLNSEIEKFRDMSKELEEILEKAKGE